MADKKRILIVSYYFAPQNVIGAVRPTKLAKYLTRMGHEVTVISGGGLDGKTDPTLERDLQELKDVRLCKEWSPLRDWYIYKRSRSRAAAASSAPAAPAAVGKQSEQSRLKKLIVRAVDAFYVYLDWFADRNFHRLAMRELKKLKGSYDVVFSSYASFAVHEIARQAKKKGLAGTWIADFRDEVDMPFGFQEKRKQRYLQMIRHEADIICSVSHGTLEIMGLDDIGRVLFNGFDREDLPQVDAVRKDRCMRFVYCGQFNMGRRGVGDRDLTPAFQAIAQLVAEGILRKEEIQLVYAGTEGALMKQYAASCGLEECVEDHGLVSRKESIRLQKEADVLLLASWNLAEQRGILTGKMFEYMMMDKPVICCMNGDLPGSAVKKVLDETGLGFCREEASADLDDAQLMNYLCGLVQRWQSGTPLLDSRNQEAVDRYSYPRLAQTFAGWLDE